MIKSQEECHEYKQMIAHKIKPILEIDAENDFDKLRTMVLSENDDSNSGIQFNERCKVGNNIVDFFTFIERLETRGKYNINFYDFVKNIEEFKKKKIYSEYVYILFHCEKCTRAKK